MQLTEEAHRQHLNQTINMLKEHHQALVSLYTAWESASLDERRKYLKYKTYLLHAELSLFDIIEMIEVESHIDLQKASLLASSVAFLTMHLMHVSRLFEISRGLQLDQVTTLTIKNLQGAAAEHARQKKLIIDAKRKSDQKSVLRAYIGNRTILKHTKFVDEHLAEIKKVGRVKQTDMPGRSGMISLMKELGYGLRKIQDL